VTSGGLFGTRDAVYFDPIGKIQFDAGAAEVQRAVWLHELAFRLRVISDMPANGGVAIGLKSSSSSD
jgi:hypothetical protein